MSSLEGDAPGRSSPAGLPAAGEKVVRTSAPTSSAADGVPPADVVPPAAKKKPKSEIESLADFVRFAYEQQGRKVALKPVTERAVCDKPDLNEPVLEALLALAAADRTLAVPRQLLLAAGQLAATSQVRFVLRALIQRILLAHPVYSNPTVGEAIRNAPDGPPMPFALRLVAGVEFSAVLAQPNAAPPRPADVEALRDNALTTLALWFTDHRMLPVGALVSLLSEALWMPRAKDRRVASYVRTLTEIANAGAIGLVCDELTKETKELRRQLEASREALRERSADIERLATQLQAAERRADALQDRVRELERESEQAKNENEAQRRRISLDLETRRTRVLRRLKLDLGLLEEGLIALRRQPPKVDVMDDHAERVADSLRQEVTKLEGE